MNKLKEEIQKVKDLNLRLSSLSDNFNEIDLIVREMEDFENVKSLYLNDTSEITILISDGRHTPNQPLISTGINRDVLDVVNLCEAVYTRRVEEVLWRVENNKTKIIEILQK